MRRLNPTALFLSLLVLLASPALGWGQTTSKRPLDHDAYDRWNSIGGQTLSADGRWIAYVVTPGKGDGQLVLRSLEGRRPGPERIIPRGANPTITADSRHLVFTLRPMQAVVDSLRRAGRRGDALPQDSLGVLILAEAFPTAAPPTSEFFKVGRVRTWRVPQEAGGYLAYHLAREQPQDTAQRGEGGGGAAGSRGGRPGAAAAGGGQDTTRAGPSRRKDEGTPLVLRNLSTGQEIRFEDVTAFEFSRDGRWLVYAASNRAGDADGVYAVRTASGEVVPLLKGEGKYTQLALSRDGNQVAFLTNRDTWSQEEPVMALYHARLGAGEARKLATQGTAGIPEGWWIREGGNLSFSDEGSRLFFETQPRPPAPPRDTVPEDERVTLDIWNWQDPLIQPMQLVQADRERNRGYRAYVTPGDGKVVQLATLDLPEIVLFRGGEGPLALGTATNKYGWWVSHDGTYRDVYLVDLASGRAELVREFQRSGAGSFSPEGRYLSWWDGAARAWMVMDLRTRAVRNVSQAVPFPVHDELDDRPDHPPAYGSAGWLKGDAAFLIYDRFDIWAVDPAGVRPPRNLTEGVGRAQQIQFRYVNPERGGGGPGGGGPGAAGGGSEGPQGIDPSRDVLLRAFHVRTKDAGFYRDRFDGSREPERLLWGPYSYGSPIKAKDADVYVLTRSRFEEFPDLWVADPDFHSMERISNANPQQAEYLWGTAELVEWISNDGLPLQGILMKPEGFDPSKKYPMMVYFYETNSDGLHRYSAPSAGSSSVNPSFYVSRGYVFFIPDIYYEIGHPGESAVDCVIPGILKILEMGFVDKERIGVQGHSWGGYQVAYLITRTNLFAAAEAGAPVSNMISAYGGIRWESGMSRQFQYEKTQSRIGGSLWERPMHFIENSPIFNADKVTTPLLMMHNDQDGAVPWYQGIEFYMALRRLQKPVWLLNYNGEAHGLRREANRKDFAIRMQQFFDHYLKGEPAPIWMTQGVPAVQKGRTLGLELDIKGTP